MKKTAKIFNTNINTSIRALLKHDNAFVLNQVDAIENDEERKKKIIEIINYLDDCLLDREIGNKGPKLKDLLNQRLQVVQASVKEYSIEDLIWWKGTEGQLIYLYEQLVQSNLIDQTQDDRKYVLLSKHFKNKSGGLFTNKQMSQAAQNLVINKNRIPKKANLITEAIDKTKSLR